MLLLRLSTDAPLRGRAPSESFLGAADLSLLHLLRDLTTADGRPALALRLGCVLTAGAKKGASVLPNPTSWVPLDAVADDLPPLALQAPDAVDAGNGLCASAPAGTLLVVLVVWPQVQTMELACRRGLSACLAAVASRRGSLHRPPGSSSEDTEGGSGAIYWTPAEQADWLALLFSAARQQPLVDDERRWREYGTELVLLLSLTVDMDGAQQVAEVLQLVRRWVRVDRPRRNPRKTAGADGENGSFWTTSLVDVLFCALSRQGWSALAGDVLGLVSAAEFVGVPSCASLVESLRVKAARSSAEEDARYAWSAARTAIAHVLAGVVARYPSDWEKPPSVTAAVEAAARFAFGVPAVHFLLDSFEALP